MKTTSTFQPGKASLWWAHEAYTYFVLYQLISKQDFFRLRVLEVISDILISSGSLALSVLSFAFVAFNPATRCPVTQCGEDSNSAFYMTQASSTPELPTFIQEAFGEDALAKTKKCQNFGEQIGRGKCSMKVVIFSRFQPILVRHAQPLPLIPEWAMWAQNAPLGILS